MKRDDNMTSSIDKDKEKLNTLIFNFLKNKDNMIAEKGLINTLKELKKISEQYQGVEFKYKDEISDFLIESIDFSNNDQIELIRDITIQMVLFKVANYLCENNKKMDSKTRKIIKPIPPRRQKRNDETTSSGSIGSRSLPVLDQTPLRCFMKSGRVRTKR